MTLRELLFTPRASEFWDELHQPAIDAFWNARREGYKENDAIKQAIDAFKRKAVEIEDHLGEG